MTPLNLRGLSVWADYKSFGDPLNQALDAFIAKAVASNHEIFRHDTRALKIKACQHCDGCFIKEVPCAYLDDFNVLAPDILQSHDLVIFAEGAFSSALKNALSKSCCFSSPNAKESALHKVYLVYEGSEAELKKEIQAYFEGVFELAPETTKVVRYDKINAEEIQKIAALATLF
jgi:multimeric flavodoxin WrbA